VVDLTAQLTERIAGREVILIDGGMRTELEARGAQMDDHLWYALVSADRPDLVRSMHEVYIRAGADVIITNTFAAGEPALEAAGHGGCWREINRAAVGAALAAREATNRQVVMAGSVGGLPTAIDITFHERGLSPSTG
jgi:S-methylmethionine-dependent homocysteine/selenocysteine methylase